MKKYKVDFARCSVYEEVVLPSGKTRTRMYMLFTDFKGVHIINRKGVEYLTEENCEVI